MEQATTNSLLIIIVIVMIMAGLGLMVWRRYRPATPHPVPEPVGTGTTPTPPASPRLRNHQWFWPSVVGAVALIVITASAVIFYGPLALMVIAALSVAGYGGWKGGGAGSVIFTYLAGFLLIVVVLSLLAFGPEGAGKVYEKLQTKANDVVENGVDIGLEKKQEAAPARITRYTDGMVLNLRPGESTTILLAGKIKVINGQRGYCMNYLPEGAVVRKNSPDYTMADVSPSGDVEREVTVTKLRPGEGECPSIN